MTSTPSLLPPTARSPFSPSLHFVISCYRVDLRGHCGLVGQGRRLSMRDCVSRPRPLPSPSLLRTQQARIRILAKSEMYVILISITSQNISQWITSHCINISSGKCGLPGAKAGRFQPPRQACAALRGPRPHRRGATRSHWSVIIGRPSVEI